MKISELRCEVCNKGLADGISLYRVNEKGVPAIWRCEEHLEKEPDPEVKNIVDILSKTD